MLSFLSGGTGTPKLLRGIRSWMPDDEIAVIVNTAEDLWISGNHLAPDLDTVMYLFAGTLDMCRWWGLEGDTFTTHDAVRALGVDEYISIGDRDRGVHILRGELLRQGMSLTGATRVLCEATGAKGLILPMTDTPVASMVRTTGGWIHFQEYWVRHLGAIDVLSVERRWEERPVATQEVRDAIRRSEGVVIGPGNPVTSILPILECEGMVPLLREKPVIAISPFIGREPVSGPAATLMKARGIEPSSLGIYDLYRDFTDIFVQDIRDTLVVPGAVRFDTLMIGQSESMHLAGQVLELVRHMARVT